MSGKDIPDITLWLLVGIAIVAIFLLYKFYVRRRKERIAAKNNPEISKARKERFEKHSRYAKQVTGLLNRYPAMKLHPQIVENVSVNTLPQFDRFDMEKKLTELLADPSDYETSIKQAAQQTAQYPFFIEELRNIHSSTKLEASLLNLSMEECKHFEKSWIESQVIPDLDRFIVCYVEYQDKSGQHADKTLYMTFDDFRAFCQSKKSLKNIEDTIQREIDDTTALYEQDNSYEIEEQFISFEHFNKAYSANYGNDRPGVYIILLYEPDQRDLTTRNYSDVYVGQSLTVYHRIRQHFTGHGNGDVYADIKYGKPAYVKIVFCEEQKLNSLEKKYIAEYNATNSYNSTKGGGAVRG